MRPPSVWRGAAQLTVSLACSRIFYEKRMSQEVAVDTLGDEFKGYVVRITGGNDVRPAALRTRVRARPLTPRRCPSIEAGFPPQAGSPCPPPRQAPSFQGPLVLPAPQDRRAQAQVGPRMHRRCRRSRPRARHRQAGRERHPRPDRRGAPQAPRPQARDQDPSLL